jgi:hypothetical protein
VHLQENIKKKKRSMYVPGYPLPFLCEILGATPSAQQPLAVQFAQIFSSSADQVRPRCGYIWHGTPVALELRRLDPFMDSNGTCDPLCPFFA